MKTDRYGISGSTLKIIAAISMVLDHVSRIVLTNGIMTHASYNQISDEQWAILSEASDVLHVLGRIAFPLFCFLIVEGFLHTHDIKKYLRNMLVFAIIAEPIYDFVQTGQLFDLRQQNVMCELLLSLVFLIQDFSLLAAQRPALNHPLRGWRQTALQSHPSDRY